MKRFFIVVIFCLLIPLFFYNLGNYGLADFDESWYADIARNILHTGSLFALKFNFMPYFDHPPLGFWLMALSFKFFGVNEFAVRFPSALLGFSSLVIVYLLGKHLKNSLVGLGAALILSSSVWFVFRARTGNLDAPLTFFYLLTILLALKKKYILTGIAFGLCLLTKSLVGLSLLLPLFVIFLLDKPKVKNLTKMGLTCLIFITPWFVTSYLNYGPVFIERLIHIGLRPGMGMVPNWLHLFSSNTFIYLHSGLRKWYWPALITLPISFLLVKKTKVILAFNLLVAALMISFLTNQDTSIWHLIPLFPIFALLISFVGDHFLGKISFVIILLIAAFQIYTFRGEIQLNANGYSDTANLAMTTKNRPEDLYLDGPDLLPGIVFYSGKSVKMVYWSNLNWNSLKKITDHGPKPFLLITEEWRLEMDRIPKDEYKVVAERSGRMLLLVSNEKN